MPTIAARTAILAAVVALLLAPATPAGATTSSRIAAMVAGAHTIFTLRDNRVVALDAAGREMGRCSRFEAPPPERPAAAPGAIVDVDEALRLAGLPDDDPDSVEAEDALADEGLLARRRPRAAGAAGIVARALAASPAGDDVWIASSSGLFHGRDGTCARAALPGRDLVAVAADGESVAAASEELLWRADGAGAFRIAAGLTARPRVLAVVDSGHTLVASDDGVTEIGPWGGIRPVLDEGADALAVCGGVALAFAGDGVWTWTGDAPPRRVGERPAARALVCGDGHAARFVAVGGGLYSSADGAAWRDWNPAPGRSVAAAAAIADRIWIAVDDDVIPLRTGAAPGPVPPPVSRAPSAPPRLPLGELEDASFPWPRLMLVLAGQRSALRDAWSLVVLVAFPLGRPPASAAPRRQLAADLLRRDADLAAQEEEATLSLPNTDDPSRAARLRAIRQEREALR
jgi:hypothetical protein